VCVHGIPFRVSPVKDSRSRSGVRYFKAMIGDCKKMRRVVSFDPALQPAIKKAVEDKSVVALTNSIVKKSSVTHNLEVHLNQYSKVTTQD